MYFFRKNVLLLLFLSLLSRYTNLNRVYLEKQHEHTTVHTNTQPNTANDTQLPLELNYIPAHIK